MKFENTDVWGFAHALRGMRNPMNSWDKSDTFIGGNSGTDCDCKNCTCTSTVQIGENDLHLAQTLIKAGSEHRKFLRQIFVSVDITAPLYWWKEFDTYKVGTVSNSCSTMHKLASTPITKECFEMDDFENIQFMGKDIFGANCSKDTNAIWERIILFCEELRQKYNETKDIHYWKELIRMLPESWLQTRTITMNYENLYSIVRHRKNHKLTEWSESFMAWVHSLPYAEGLIFLDEVENNENANK